MDEDHYSLCMLPFQCNLGSNLTVTMLVLDQKSQHPCKLKSPWQVYIVTNCIALATPFFPSQDASYAECGAIGYEIVSES